MRNNEIYLGGHKISDCKLRPPYEQFMQVDAFIAIIGWETRSLNVVSSGSFYGERCYLIRFDGDDLEPHIVEQAHTEAKKHFKRVEILDFPNALDYEEVMTRTEEFTSQIADHGLGTCVVDYTSMPRSITQMIFRKFMVDGFCPYTLWAYSPGLYDQTELVASGLSQGASKFFSIRGALGNGGMASERVAVLALGADRSLVRSFIREHSFDRFHFLDARSSHSPALGGRIDEQRLWLQSDLGILPESFISCDAESVVQTIKVFLEIANGYPAESGVSIELFSSGPKTHSVAAATLLTSFKNIRLVGRRPDRYIRMDVKSAEEIALTTVIDYTNPRVFKELLRLRAGGTNPQ
ncbi:hypothetical protein CLV79_106192 [Limimaricola soesokkakensis]|uniref:Uncharacterized protein n=1 Tax=Limimaricola soesokkakensis TaxID=1343159 RepID=A0A1X6ZF68_9RHOB|nr:hypothetical protein [Limimaricola soesokkakensis]PSK86183.1 hypothetical protein CLV79_106192 [Limimaricola soesokkakensis]SLN49389.1 hypothetical protein LOS8367_02188 [Limimaricola soesokkakensis]